MAPPVTASPTGLGHRQALAGDQRLVDLAAALDDLPSTATRSPGRTTTRSPTFTCATGTSTSDAVGRTRAVSGAAH
jgi:hypothetical protein